VVVAAFVLPRAVRRLTTYSGRSKSVMLGPVGCLRIELFDPVEHRFGERPVLLRGPACRPEVIDNKRPCASLPP